MKKKLTAGILTAVLSVSLTCQAPAAVVDAKWFYPDAELSVQITEVEEKMSHAHDMAEAARALGMDEDSETILLAKDIWNTANAERQAYLDTQSSSQTVEMDLFTNSGLTEEAFNVMLDGSDLAGHGSDLVELERTYGINGVYALAVANTESGLGSSKLAKNKCNYFGMLGCSYATPKEGILAFGALMTKTAYKDKSLDAIAKIYCPPTSSQWAAAVRSSMTKFWDKLI